MSPRPRSFRACHRCIRMRRPRRRVPASPSRPSRRAGEPGMPARDADGPCSPANSSPLTKKSNENRPTTSSTGSNIRKSAFAGSNSTVPTVTSVRTLNATPFHAAGTGSQRLSPRYTSPEMMPRTLPNTRSSTVPAKVNSPTTASASVRVPSVDGSASAMSRITMRDPTPAATKPASAPRLTAQTAGPVARQIARNGDPGAGAGVSPAVIRRWYHARFFGSDLEPQRASQYQA